MDNEKKIKELEHEIAQVAGETLALQRLLIELLSRLALSDPNTLAIVRASFNETARFLEDRAIEAGTSARPDHLVHSIRVIEDLRTATLGNRDKPKSGV